MTWSKEKDKEIYSATGESSVKEETRVLGEHEARRYLKN